MTDAGAMFTRNGEQAVSKSVEEMLNEPLWQEGPWLAEGLVPKESSIRKSLFKVRDLPDRPDSSKTSGMGGRLEQPFNMELADSMVEVNPYHGSCQSTLVSATCGGGICVIDEDKTAEVRRAAEQTDVSAASAKLGVVDYEATEALYEILDSMCEHDFDSLLHQVVSNFWGIGQGYIEAVRSDDLVSGLYWVPGTEVWRHHFRDGRREDYFFSSTSGDLNEVVYAAWRKREKVLRANEARTEDLENLTELIDFVRPTTRWEGYGSPHWLAAIPYMDVDVRALQRVSDYMFNGGMPSSMVFLGGANMSAKQVENMRAVMSGATGNRTGAGALFTLPQAPKDRCWLEHVRIGDSVDGSNFQEMHGTINLSVASANQVPPVLAGITTPGKMGAANEMVQAIMTLHTNVIAPVQSYLAKRLMRTLFSNTGGVRGLAGTKIRFKTWIESMDMAALNTVARQREQVAVNPDRDPDEGLYR